MFDTSTWTSESIQELKEPKRIQRICNEAKNIIKYGVEEMDEQRSIGNLDQLLESLNIIRQIFSSVNKSPLQTQKMMVKVKSNEFCKFILDCFHSAHYRAVLFPNESWINSFKLPKVTTIYVKKPTTRFSM